MNHNRTEIFYCIEDFEAREDKTINGMSPGLAKIYPNWRDGNATNVGCMDCAYCSDCVDCIGCNNAHMCTRCTLAMNLTLMEDYNLNKYL